MSTDVTTPRATRPMTGRVVAGVAIGLAEHLHVRVWAVRVAFVVLTFAGGIGLVLYVAFWAALPLNTQAATDPTVARSSDTTRLLSLIVIVVGIGLSLAALGVDFARGAVLPLLIAIVGAALIWRQTDDEQRDTWSAAASKAAQQTVDTSAAAGRWRIAVGIVLVVFALVALLLSQTGPAAALQGLSAALLILGGVALVTFPWIYRLLREQSQQRRALIRAEERADIAAHVHDSVLQTLTLIQRASDDPQEVARLARTEERALRSWLYAPDGDPERTFAAALKRDAADIESSYDATIELVTVGDTDLDPALSALVAAAREAMVNAARHGGHEASVYAEVDEHMAEVFIRDHGSGFDLESIPADRHGVRESIIRRMERNGGSATVRSSPETGTEIQLRLPRDSDVTP
ncbi:MAG: PspC domain-containing protein [Actinobacteria bacterium]|nr:PspC domain-containing protein [Actinomycetota bacterium]